MFTVSFNFFLIYRKRVTLTKKEKITRKKRKIEKKMFDLIKLSKFSEYELLIF